VLIVLGVHSLDSSGNDKKTRAVVNCPVIYTDAGGLLPKAVIRLKNGGVYQNQ
jgi:hypothetical protein